MTRAVFLDRDGVLNVERSYITTPEELELLPGAARAVAELNAAGWPTVVFTNQSGVGRGYLTLATLETIHAKLKAEVEAGGGKIRAIYACPHGPDSDCDCRKPKTGLLRQAAQELGLDLAACFVVGDSLRDIEAGRAAGCRTILVLSGHTRAYDPETMSAPHPDHVFPDLAAAAKWICESA